MTASLFESLLALAVLVVVLAALRVLLWHALRGLGLAWAYGPDAVRQGATRLRADYLGNWLSGRFPRAARFLRNRTDPLVFTGLPLTLVACAAFYALFLFAGLVEELIESEEIRTADALLVSWVDPLRTGTLVAIFGWITDLGSMPTLTAAAFVASAFLLAHGPRRYVAPLWLTVIGSQITTFSGKFILARPRPDFILDVTVATPSFPSGHTTGAMAVYSMIAYAVLRDIDSPRARFDVAYGTAVLIALVSFSRVFLGVHHPSDVAAGLLVGLFWLLAGIALAEIRRLRE
jgi:membrane-associated phospholipid phosphatase